MASPVLQELFSPRGVSDFPGPMVRKASRVVAELRAAWDRTGRDALESGRVAELHAARDDYRSLLQGHIRFLGEYLALARLHRRAFGTNPAWVEELNRAEGELRSFHDELFPRWESPESLRELLADHFTGPDAHACDLTDTPPPASFVRRSGDAFSAD